MVSRLVFVLINALENQVYVDIPLSLVHDSDVEFIAAADRSKALAKQCSQQRITAPQSYQSYNFFALVLIFFFGIVVPGTAIVLRTSHAKLWRINPKGHRFLSYQAEGLMQLHRMALEGSGFGGWEGGVKETPRTVVAEKRIPQVMLDDEDADKDPMLRYPRRGHATQSFNGHLAKQGYEEVSKDDSDVIIR